MSIETVKLLREVALVEVGVLITVVLLILVRYSVLITAGYRGPLMAHVACLATSYLAFMGIAAAAVYERWRTEDARPGTFAIAAILGGLIGLAGLLALKIDLRRRAREMGADYSQRGGR